MKRLLKPATTVFVAVLMSSPALAAEINGTEGPDVLIGKNVAADTINALGDDDTIMILGHVGFDRIRCGDGSDTINMTLLSPGQRTGIDLGRHAAYNSTVLDCENVVGTNASIGDRLIGDAGSNSIRGGLGGDAMTGRDGADTFVYVDPNDSTPASPDVITDFAPDKGDTIDLSALAAHAILGKLHYIGKESFTGVPGQVRFSRAPSQTPKLSVDFDGDRKTDLVMILLRKTRGMWVATRSPTGLPKEALILE